MEEALFSAVTDKIQCNEEDGGITAFPPRSPLTHFFLLSLLALLSAVLNVAQVQRAHRPSLLQTIRPSE